ncbi:MAG: 50S ribosomal protein L39e [Promethearchaeota archaeon]
MARNKSLGKKIRLCKAGRQNQPIPTWIVMKTKGTVRNSPHTYRNWRRNSIKP